MRILITILFLVNTLLGLSQDTIYLNSELGVITDNINFDFYEVIVFDEKKKRTIVTLYNAENIIEARKQYIDFATKKLHGLQVDDGSEGKWTLNYKDGVLHGELKNYWPNGKLKREDWYRNGILSKGGVCFDENGKQIGYYFTQNLPGYIVGFQKATSTTSVKTDEYLSIRQVKFSKKYYLGSDQISKRDFVDILKTNLAASHEYINGKNIDLIGNIIGLPAGFVFGYLIGGQIAGKKAATTPLVISGLCSGIALGLNLVGGNKIKSSIQTYNNSKNIGLNLNLNENGIGLALKF